ncbi:hypothetical protein ACFQV2_12040 [Actinokineospora soli]|uniref:Uncharacterized protein n=1 Tax=Actinokineospora soli TaxID=1048753 RepID=A0ABW2TNQ1_9PSEU
MSPSTVSDSAASRDATEYVASKPSPTSAAKSNHSSSPVRREMVERRLPCSSRLSA